MSTYDSNTPVPGDLARQEHKQKSTEDSNLVMWGWIGFFFFPPAAFVIGIVLLSHGHRKGHGGWMLGLTVVWFIIICIVIIAALAAGAASYSDCLDTASSYCQ